MSKTDFVPSIKKSEIKEGQMKPARVKGRPILLVRRGGEVFGYQIVVRIWVALLKEEFDSAPLRTKLSTTFQKPTQNSLGNSFSIL
ncbi:hypothetical protein MUP42_02435 [Candidatus Bathyarchaeota archaeon]|nr:hypothetical protein [Candidatus Bathyarchaeota archaeon]